ncbi:PAS domain-containing protein [Rhodospirillaceae bacterium KN72]|uniref:PAS domain-containing protein n=1 Tax=Pacificispira spongiicola TaxID=2729598 RepID=A0A7Y0HEH7_9PROT|nr:PAS domain-containing protein [Pacificispira spongiicola]NMM44871.1 PAS domain-containing protein [Pacificispira spongiicola]
MKDARPPFVGAGFDDPRFILLYSHWNNIRPPGSVPSRRAIDPIEIFRLLPIIWLCDYCESKDTFRFRLAGEEICAPYQRNIKGMTLDQMFDGDRFVYANTQLKKTALDPCINLVSGFKVWNVDRYNDGMRLILPLLTDGIPGIVAITIAIPSVTPEETDFDETMLTAHAFPIPA